MERNTPSTVMIGFRIAAGFTLFNVLAIAPLVWWWAWGSQPEEFLPSIVMTAVGTVTLILIALASQTRPDAY